MACPSCDPIVLCVIDWAARLQILGRAIVDGLAVIADPGRAAGIGFEPVGQLDVAGWREGNVPVLSPTRITPENNGKIRPQPNLENAFVRAIGGSGVPLTRVRQCSSVCAKLQ